jgi:CDP-glycerol glycerophosphotransferase
MVTDYSSTMFDFAVTGKPLLFYTYDLAHYRDALRGFYFDFHEHAPGPLLNTSTDVVDALGDLDTVRQAYAPAYERFRERYCHLEDGHATDRVIERYFGTGGPAQG